MTGRHGHSWPYILRQELPGRGQNEILWWFDSTLGSSDPVHETPGAKSWTTTIKRRACCLEDDHMFDHGLLAHGLA